MGRARTAVVTLAGMTAAVLIQVVGSARMTDAAIAAGIAGGLIAVASRFPAGALGVIIAYTPFQITLLAFLYKHGAPAVAVKDAGYLKDAMVLGIGIAAVRASLDRTTRRRKFRFLDYAAVTYVGIASVYLLLPLVLHGALGGESWSIRLNAWRLDCLFVLLLLFCRRLSFSQEALRRLVILVTIAGLVMFGGTLWETLDETGYSNFLVKRIALPVYQLDIFHTLPLYGYITHTIIGGHSFLRDGSFFADSIELGFYTVLPFALGVQMLFSSRLRLRTVVPAATAGTTVMLALTRSAILACAVTLVILVIASFPRQAKARLPVLVLVLVGMVGAGPLIAHSSVGARFATLFDKNDTDNHLHSYNSRSGLDTVIDHPGGKGLGANPTTGLRFGTANSTDTENSYLQVGTELGAAGMLAFVAMYLALLRELWERARRRGPEGELPTALLAAGGGLFVGGFFLQIWTSFAVGLTFWGFCGAVLGATTFRSQHATETPVAVPEPVVVP